MNNAFLKKSIKPVNNDALDVESEDSSRNDSYNFEYQSDYMEDEKIRKPKGKKIKKMRQQDY